MEYYERRKIRLKEFLDEFKAIGCRLDQDLLSLQEKHGVIPDNLKIDTIEQLKIDRPERVKEIPNKLIDLSGTVDLFKLWESIDKNKTQD